MPDFDYFRDILIFFAMFVFGGLGLPIPEELAIVWAGIWTATKGANYPLYRWLTLPVCITGVMIADVLLYLIGSLFGTRLLRYRWSRYIFPLQKRDRIERNFHRYGVSILVFGRLLPGIRAPLFLTAGIMRLPFMRFLFADGIGAVVGNSILFFLAFWFGDSFKFLIEQAEDTVSHIKPLIILGLIGAVTLYFIYNFLRMPIPTGDPEELPSPFKQVAKTIDSVEMRLTGSDHELKLPPATNAEVTPKPDDHGAHIEEMERK